MPASDHRLYLQLQLAAHHLKKYADRTLLEASGLTTAQAAVLSLLSEDKKVTQRHIAEILGQNESAVTAMIKRLLKSGYVKREKNETDARSWRLTITPQGRHALEQVASPFQAVNDGLDAALNGNEINALADYLGRISTSFSGR